ncbi:MAG: SRPBCC domain-containing protein [Ilumatobacter sp.]|uniref:SRPBCC family protein n=1 Tax=Ilumatobacter sp. TaxID=1967498 RepID=UPI003C75CA63
MTEQHADSPSISDAGVVVITQRIAAPPGAVFPFLVEPERMLRWMGTDVRLEPTPGGEFWLDMNGTDIAIGNFIEVDPPNRVVFTWGWHGSDDVPPGSSTVSIDLTSDGTDTIVELRHDGLPDELTSRHLEGWNHFLPLLVEQVVAS